jgi:hypothetical protein
MIFLGFCYEGTCGFGHSEARISSVRSVLLQFEMVTVRLIGAKVMWNHM